MTLILASFTQLRDLENGHNEKLLETCMLVLEKVVKNEMEDEISEDLRMVSSYEALKSLMTFIRVVLRFVFILREPLTNRQNAKP